MTIVFTEKHVLTHYVSYSSKICVSTFPKTNVSDSGPCSLKCSLNVKLSFVNFGVVKFSFYKYQNLFVCGAVPEMRVLTPLAPGFPAVSSYSAGRLGLVHSRLLAAGKLYWGQADKAATPISTTPVHTVLFHY